MPWTPPTEKWKTQRVSPMGCGNGSTGGIGPDQCVIRERFDALANPRVITTAGFEVVCADHEDPAEPVPVMQIETFQGEWMSFAEWHAWEACFYSWVVWHEIAERTDPVLDLPYTDPETLITYPTQREFMQMKQARRSAVVANGVPNVNRPTTDDGPWKPTDAITNPTAAQRAAVATVSGWAFRDTRLMGEVAQGAIDAGLPEEDNVTAYWTGSGGDRVLHANSGGRLNNSQRNQIAAAADLRFGSGRFVWDG